MRLLRLLHQLRCAPAASPAFNILFIWLLGPHTAYSTSNWSSGCAGCVGCAQLHQLRWLRWLRLLRHLRSIYCSLGFYTAYSTSNWSSGCAGCVGCAQLHQLRWLRWLRLLRHLRSIYCSLGFYTAYSTSNWSSGCAGCVGCAQLHQLRWLRFRQRSCVSANAAKQTVTPPGYLSLTGELWDVYLENFEENWPRYRGTALYWVWNPSHIQMQTAHSYHYTRQGHTKLTISPVQVGIRSGTRWLQCDNESLP